MNEQELFTHMKPFKEINSIKKLHHTVVGSYYYCYWPWPFLDNHCNADVWTTQLQPLFTNHSMHSFHSTQHFCQFSELCKTGYTTNSNQTLFKPKNEPFL
jgi:hypothetical protein